MWCDIHTVRRTVCVCVCVNVYKFKYRYIYIYIYLLKIKPIGKYIYIYLCIHRLILFNCFYIFILNLFLTYILFFICL